MPRNDRHTKFVAWAKIILPITALGLLSSLYLFSHRFDPSLAVRSSRIDVRELAREQSVSGAEFAGTTKDGSAVRITAVTAKPAPDDRQRILATTVTARIKMPDGATIHVAARNGIVDTAAHLLTLSGKATITTATGYRINSKRFIASLDQTHVTSPGPVQASGPPGTLTAGSMELSQQPQGYVLVFKAGVKLIYHPKH